MKDLAIFNYHDKSIRTITDENGNPWFVAKDIAEILGYANPSRSINDHCKLVKILKTTDSVVFEIPTRVLQIIPEPDVYRLVSKSTLPAAEQFEVWIFEEVLPAIRKTGGYITSNIEDTNEEILARAVLVAQEALKRRDERIKSLESENEVCRMNSNIKTAELIKTYTDDLNDTLETRNASTMYALFGQYSVLPFVHMREAFVLSLICRMLDLHDKLSETQNTNDIKEAQLV